MTKAKSYQLEPTKLIPNSHYPLLHYPGYFDAEGQAVGAASVHDIFVSNGWTTQWIFRYGQTQRSHYHSQAHECMAVLSGTATIRFGVADTDEDMENNTHGTGKEHGGVEVEANAGDVFIIPAGVSHKTYDTSPKEDFVLLTPGEGHGIAAADTREALAKVQLSGFTMIGAYPEGGIWDFKEGGEHTGNYEEVWSVPKPACDPVMGQDAGLCEFWKE